MVGTRPTSELVERAQSGDQQAFTMLLREYDDRMRGLAFQMLGSQAQMDDALQDAYLKAYTSLPKFRGESAFGTWLYRIVYTTCIDHIRRRDRKREVGLHALPDLPTKGDAVGAVDVRDQVSQALATLSEDHRATLILIDREGLSYDEVAIATDTAPGTVASRLNRARTAFKTAMNTLDEETNR